MSLHLKAPCSSVSGDSILHTPLTPLCPLVAALSLDFKGLLSPSPATSRPWDGVVPDVGLMGISPVSCKGWPAGTAPCWSTTTNATNPERKAIRSGVIASVQKMKVWIFIIDGERWLMVKKILKLACMLSASYHFVPTDICIKKSYELDESDDDLDDMDRDDLHSKTSSKSPEEIESDGDIVESDIELEGEIVEPDNDPPQKMGDPSVEVTDENRDAAQMAKGKAMEAISEGNLEEAIEHLTEAIVLNPMSAIMYATRASAFIKMKKPNAAIRDASAALEINPDSAKGYKTRGMALAMLGQWEEAAKDLHLASKLDYDEEISIVLKKVEPNAHKIEEHRRKYERMRKEREEKKVVHERQRRRAEAQAAYEKAKKKEQSSSCGPCGGTPSASGGCAPGGCSGGMPGGMPSGFPGGMPGGMPGNIDMNKILNDPELMAAFKDPEVMAALQDVMNDPANFAKHQANPKVAPVITKMMSKFAGTK